MALLLVMFLTAGGLAATVPPCGHALAAEPGGPIVAQDPEPIPESPPGDTPTPDDPTFMPPEESAPAVEAPPETLSLKPAIGPAAPGAKPAAPKPRKPPFGLHPAAIFAILLAGHIFVVRAVSD